MGPTAERPAVPREQERLQGKQVYHAQRLPGFDTSVEYQDTGVSLGMEPTARRSAVPRQQVR